MTIRRMVVIAGFAAVFSACPSGEDPGVVEQPETSRTRVPVRGIDDTGIDLERGGETIEAARVPISGHVFLRERIALPADARLEVQLVVIGGPADPPREVASARVPVSRRHPIPFELLVDAGQLSAGSRYGLTAAISRRGVKAFATDAPLPILDSDTPTTGLRLLLRRCR